MNYLTFQIYLIKCPRVSSSNGDISVLNKLFDWFNVIRNIYLYKIFMYVIYK
jgi:hypothetical protein